MPSCITTPSGKLSAAASASARLVSATASSLVLAETAPGTLVGSAGPPTTPVISAAVPIDGTINPRSDTKMLPGAGVSLVATGAGRRTQRATPATVTTTRPIKTKA